MAKHVFGSYDVPIIIVSCTASSLKKICPRLEMILGTFQHILKAKV